VHRLSVRFERTPFALASSQPPGTACLKKAIEVIR
jgi:hypothetical protein